MNTQPLRWLLIIGAGVLTGLLLLTGVILLLGNTMFRPMFHPMSSPLSQFLPGQFDSNGERIYFTGTSDSGQPVVADMLGTHRMQAGMIACVNCHGPEGRGGTISMMMGTFQVPDIRYSILTTENHEQSEAEGAGREEHPAYTDEAIKRAITQGIDPAGNPLNWPMPNWRMSESDLEDLVAYLKSLE